MGTYTDSRITVARKERECWTCKQPIHKGGEQLSYKPGLRSTIYLHVPCAASGLRDAGLWRCKALEDRIHA